MTDKELLKLAAKAAGIEKFLYGNLRTYSGFYLDGCFVRWNPLTDDGDALRLAVKLRICVNQQTDLEGKEFAAVSAVFDDLLHSYFEYFNDDPYAATRRAIVRAAAEFGKGMK